MLRLIERKHGKKRYVNGRVLLEVQKPGRGRRDEYGKTRSKKKLVETC